MIERLRIKYFQSLGDLDLQLGKVTVVTGHSDSGKSALLRAVETVCFNDQIDARTCREGKVHKTEIRIETDEHAVVYRRGRSVEYEVEHDGQVETWTKLNKIVPDRVSEVLGVREVQIDSGTGPTSWSRIQFVGQFDLPFLLVDRGGVAAARILGRLTGAHVLAEAGRLAKQDASSIADRRKVLDVEREKVLAELEALKDVETEVARLEDVAKLLQDTREKQAFYDRLCRLIAGYESAKRQLAEIRYDPTEAERLENIRLVLQKVWQLMATLTKLESLVEKRQILAKTMVDLKAKSEQEIPDISRLRDLMQAHKRIEATIQVCTQVQQRHAQAQQVLHESVVNLEAAEKALAEAEKLIPSCPFRDRFAEFRGTTQQYRCRELLKVIA